MAAAVGSGQSAGDLAVARKTLVSINKGKSVWILVKRFDLTEGKKQPVMLREINVAENCSSQVMRKTLCQELQLPSQYIILKLRNNRGSLIIPKGSIPSNTKASPYSLDVYRVHQNVKPREKAGNQPEYTELIRSVLDAVMSKVSRMETDLPELNKRKEAKLDKCVGDSRAGQEADVPTKTVR